jgi:hypothetical protein
MESLFFEVKKEISFCLQLKKKAASFKIRGPS